MNRRAFLERAAAVLSLAPTLGRASGRVRVDLTDAAVSLPANASQLEQKAAAVLVEETEKRSGLRWNIGSSDAQNASAAIRLAVVPAGGKPLRAESFAIEVQGRSISIAAPDGRGLLFGAGKVLRSIVFAEGSAELDLPDSRIIGAPRYRVRGHQLGYRPKTNSYDGWNVATWDQYIRDLAMFGTNTIELIPPRSDDAARSPHFPLPPERMMVEMARIAASYDLAVSIWYPQFDREGAEEWERLFGSLARIDAVFIPGGDPGGNSPEQLFAFAEKQKTVLRRLHPQAQMWLSLQGFDEQRMNGFLRLAAEQPKDGWLNGIVFGPQTRLSLPELRRHVPAHLPIRLYPDITHSLECQFPVPDWDVGYALSEGRECINPRPKGQADILRGYLPETIGFVTYSEGCNDDVNKFVWSALGWDPGQPVIDVLREYARYFVGADCGEGLAQGLLDLEENWRGPLATKQSVSVTLERSQDMERRATPAMLLNWRFQQPMFRAYYDAFVRSRILAESAATQRALDILERVNEIGWTPEPFDVGERPSSLPNGLDPALLIDEANRTLPAIPVAEALRQRVLELGEALFQSIHMQLAVNRYQGEAVSRGANLETLDTPLTDGGWLGAHLADIRKLATAAEQIDALKQLLARTDPGPGGCYDQLGNPANRPHVVIEPDAAEDPEFRRTLLTGFEYPDSLGKSAPVAWKRWGESLFDAPLRLHYDGLDPDGHYRLRVVYSGNASDVRVRLVANEKYEIHALLKKPWPPKPIEFDLPAGATSAGRLDLAWTREPGLGGNGRGCQVSEVWLIKK